MRLFHLGWCEGQLYLWGETPEEDLRVGDGEPGVLPRVCRGEVLRDLLEERELPVEGEAERIIAWLPTVDGTAVPSSSMLEVGGNWDKEGEPTLEPWRVPARPLGPEAVLDLLVGDPDRRMFGPGKRRGNDLADWARVARFAGALVGC